MPSSDRVGRERVLRSAVLAGDERAWQTWYDESFDGLYAYVSWRCAGLRDLTEEVVQDTWLTAAMPHSQAAKLPRAGSKRRMRRTAVSQVSCTTSSVRSRSPAQRHET